MRASRGTFVLRVRVQNSRSEACGGWDHGGGPLVDGMDAFGVVDPAQVRVGDPEIGVPELTLDHDAAHRTNHATRRRANGRDLPSAVALGQLLSAHHCSVADAVTALTPAET